MNDATTKSHNVGEDSHEQPTEVPNEGLATTTSSPPATARPSSSSYQLPPWSEVKALLSKLPFPAVLTAMVSLATAGTNYAIDQSKVSAERESLAVKLAAEKESQDARLAAETASQNANIASEAAERKSRNDAAERDLRTKYVDLALQPELGADHRARIFGYLSAVLQDQQQRKWAAQEAEAGQRQRQELVEKRAELVKALGDASSNLQGYLQQVNGGLVGAASKALQVHHQNKQNHIDDLRKQVTELEGSACVREAPAASAPETVMATPK